MAEHLGLPRIAVTGLIAYFIDQCELDTCANLSCVTIELMKKWIHNIKREIDYFNNLCDKNNFRLTAKC